MDVDYKALSVLLEVIKSLNWSSWVSGALYESPIELWSLLITGNKPQVEEFSNAEMKNPNAWNKLVWTWSTWQSWYSGSRWLLRSRPGPAGPQFQAAALSGDRRTSISAANAAQLQL